MKDTLDFLRNTLNKYDKVVIACSGGPDSMFLLHVIKTLEKELELKIICAHVNHGLRKESEKEAFFVKEYCDENNIIFEYMKIDKYKNDKFSEEEGRRKRYAFFNEVIKKYNSNILMTAHHGDDLVETTLMRIVRGSNLKGYIGISRIKENSEYKIVRPLLNLTKEDIINYLDNNNIEYVVDKSNESEKYTRNRFRKQLLPFLKKESKDVHLKFLKFSKELEEANNFINKEIEKYNKFVYKDNYIIIDEFLKLDNFLKRKIIEYIIVNIQKDNILDISDKQLDNIMKLVNKRENKKINLSNNFIARISYNILYIEQEVNKDDYEFILDENKVILNKYKFNFLNESRDKSNNIIRLNSKEIKLPLIVRNIKDGDKIKIKNLNGSKKVKDVFINEKIDLLKRKEYPLVCDSKNNIIWIPGLKKSIFDKDITEFCDIIVKYTEEKYE